MLLLKENVLKVGLTLEYHTLPLVLNDILTIVLLHPSSTHALSTFIG